MKINFNKAFVDAFGKPIEGKNIGEQVAMMLFGLSTINGATVTQEKKYMAYRICSRITSNPDEVEMSAEDCALVKEVSAEVFAAGAYGQICDLIES